MTGLRHFQMAAVVGIVVADRYGVREHFARTLAGQHLPFGLALPAPVVQVLALVSMVVAAGLVAGFAGWLPDVDGPGTLGNELPGFLRPIFGGHRHGTHSIIGVVLFWFAARYGCAGLGVMGPAATLLPVLCVSGVLTHLAGDFLTDHGIRPFWLPSPLVWLLPDVLRTLPRYHLRIFEPVRFTTGTWPELPVTLAAAGICAALLVGPANLLLFLIGFRAWSGA